MKRVKPALIGLPVRQDAEVSLTRGDSGDHIICRCRDDGFIIRAKAECGRSHGGAVILKRDFKASLTGEVMSDDIAPDLFDQLGW